MGILSAITRNFKPANYDGDTQESRTEFIKNICEKNECPLLKGITLSTGFYLRCSTPGWLDPESKVAEMSVVTIQDNDPASNNQDQTGETYKTICGSTVGIGPIRS